MNVCILYETSRNILFTQVADESKFPMIPLTYCEK